MLYILTEFATGSLYLTEINSVHSDVKAFIAPLLFQTKPLIKPCILLTILSSSDDL